MALMVPAGTITYEPAVYTVTTTGVTKVITLQPQTTGFRPTESAAGSCFIFPKDILCQGSDEISGNVSFGADCFGDIYVSATTRSRPTQCFPENYHSIFSPFGEYDDVPTIAYPGTACISHWTAACTTTIYTVGILEPYVQTWCCPPGGWTCFSAADGEYPYRDCVSLLSTPTSVWMRATITDTGGVLTTNWSSFTTTSLSHLSTAGPIVIRFAPFPLDGRRPTSRGANTSSTIQAVDSNPELSKGALAGIVVGAVVAVLVLGAGVFTFWRKRKQRRAGQASTGDAAEGEHRDGLKAGYDGKPELSSREAEVSEMSASTKPVELSSRVRPIEVAADSRPVELE